MNIDIRPARDLDEVAILMNEAWPRPCWSYSRGLLEHYLARPKARGEWTLELRVDGRLQGFMAAVPWQGFLAGAPIAGAFTSFLTVSKAAAPLAGGLRLIRTMVEQLTGDGVDHYLTAIEAGQAYSTLVPALHLRCGVKLRSLASVGRWIGVPMLLKSRLQAKRQSPVARFDRCRELLVRVAPRFALLQVPSEPAFGAMLAGGEDALLYETTQGAHGAVALARIRGILDTRPRRNFHIDWLLSDGLTAEQCTDFFDGVISDGLARGADVVIVQDGGSVDQSWLRSRGFLHAPASIEIGQARLNPAMSTQPGSAAPVALEIF